MKEIYVTHTQNMVAKARVEEKESRYRKVLQDKFIQELVQKIYGILVKKGIINNG